MLAVLLLILMIIVAFTAGIFLWFKLGLGGSNDKFDEKGYRAIMDAKVARDDLDKQIALSIKQANRKTRLALEEDIGPNEFRRLIRG